MPKARRLAQEAGGAGVGAAVRLVGGEDGVADVGMADGVVAVGVVGTGVVGVVVVVVAEVVAGVVVVVALGVGVAACGSEAGVLLMVECAAASQLR
jgi:hypothetical protein